MKTLVMILFFVWYYNLGAVNSFIAQRDSSETAVDSLFLSYFKFLDNQSQRKEYNGDELNLSKNIINFMEKVTGIKSVIPKGHFAIYVCSEEDIIAWKKWYNNNKTKLSFSRETNSIFYQNELLHKIQPQR